MLTHLPSDQIQKFLNLSCLNEIIGDLQPAPVKLLFM